MLDFLNTHFEAFTAVIESFFFSFWLFAIGTKRRKRTTTTTTTITARAVAIDVVVGGILGFDTRKAIDGEEGD